MELVFLLIDVIREFYSLNFEVSYLGFMDNMILFIFMRLLSLWFIDLNVCGCFLIFGCD